MATFAPEISNQDVADWVTTAFEGGSNYWCENAEYLDVELRDAVSELTSGPVYAHADYWGNGGRMRIQENEEGKWYEISKKKLIDALYLDCVSDNVGRRLVSECEYDADDADILLQAAAFNEVIFG